MKPSHIMKRYEYMFLLLVLVHPVLGQEDLDVHLDSAREMLGAMGMVSFAGLRTDRGGIVYNREDLNVYLECEEMMNRSLRAHHNKPFLELFIYRIMGYTGTAGACNGLSLLDSALLYCRKAEAILASPAFRQTYQIKLSKDRDYKNQSQAEKEKIIAENTRMYAAMVYKQEAIAYSRLNQPRLAISLWWKYLKIEDDTGDRFEIFQQMGENYRTLQREDSALSCFRQALDEKGGSAVRRAYLYHLMGDSYLYAHGRSLGHCLRWYDSASCFIAHLYRDHSPLGGGGIKSPYPEHEQADNAVGEMDWDPGSVYHEDLDAIFAGGTKAWLAKGAESAAGNTLLDSAFAYSESGRALGLRRLMKVIAIESTKRYIGGAAIYPRHWPDSSSNRNIEDTISVVTRLKTITTPLLTYRLARDELIIFLRTSAGVLHCCRRKISDDSLFRLVLQYRDELGVGYDSRGKQKSSQHLVTQKDTDAGKQLGELLFPVEWKSYFPSNGELVIIPHSFLALLPFSALPMAGAPVATRYATRLVPSIDFLAAVENRPYLPVGSSDLTKSLVIAVPHANKDSSDEEDLPELKFAASEAEAVSKVLGSPVYKDREIGLNLKLDSLLPLAAIIHFAMHAIVYTDIGTEYHSYLAFAADTVYTSHLDVRYIINNETPDLKADLVILSACETSLGTISGMEGVLGLHRAFLAKGAHSVISSLWSVSDSSSAFFMKRFYSHFLSDPDHPAKAEALRRAQLDVKQEYDDVFYWGCFQLVGGK